MKQNSCETKLSEIEFSNLCSHYKDTFDFQLIIIKQRDRLFYILLIILALFSFQIVTDGIVNSALSDYINTQFGITIAKSSHFFGLLLWSLLFGFSTKYFQLVIQIENQYKYLHNLEKTLNYIYKGTEVFTREGKSYLNRYPLFLNWIWFLYTIAFPLLLLVSITIRIYMEIAQMDILGSLLFPSFFTYILVGTTTILYLCKLHNSFLKKLKNIHKAIRVKFKKTGY